MKLFSGNQKPRNTVYRARISRSDQSHLSADLRCHTDEPFFDGWSRVERSRIFRAVAIRTSDSSIVRHEWEESPDDLSAPMSSPSWPTLHRLGGAVANADVRGRIQAFIRRSIKAGYCPGDLPSFQELCEKSDDKLFRSVTSVDTHPLHIFLPPKVARSHGLRKRAHCYKLPEKVDSLDEQNFIIRMMFKNIYWTFRHVGSSFKEFN